MQTLLNPLLLPFPSSKPTKSLLKPLPLQTPNPISWRIRLPKPPNTFKLKAFTSDEFPVDETFLEKFGPKDKETEDEARTRNCVERNWAPWEEILSPEADFARKSLNEGEEVALTSPEAIEAFRMFRPNYRQKKIEESGLTEDDFLAKQFEIRGEILEPLETSWTGPLVVRLMPPRDWPPKGWEVDEKLEFIREAHKLQAVRVDVEDVQVNKEVDNMCLERYKMFLKQYKEWVVANKDRLEEESYKYDQDYCSGRRKRGEDYRDDMLELPFYYRGQYWWLILVVMSWLGPWLQVMAG